MTTVLCWGDMEVGCAMVDGDDGRWLSISEAARQLSVSRQAIHHRIKRGTLQVQVNNHGQRLVKISAQVPRAVTGSNPSVTVDVAELRQPVHDVLETVPLALHRETIEALQTALGVARAGIDAERARHEAEVERLVGQVHAERSFWIERADAAEVRAERAEQRLNDLRRPWWLRLFDDVKRSKLGE